MTSRERYNVWLLGKYGVIDSCFEAWQAAERDILERCVLICESRISPGTGSRDILLGAAHEMKELLS